MKLYIKWSDLTNAQRQQVESFFSEKMKEEEGKKIVLNQGTYLINQTNGNFVPQKDF